MQQQARYQWSYWRARMFCIGLILVLACACGMPSMVSNVTPTRSPTMVPTKAPVTSPSPTSTATLMLVPSAPPVTSPAGWDETTSENWSGYTFPQGNVTGVRAAWTEPEISNVSNAHVVTWIGIGGWDQSYNNIVQIGTLAAVLPGSSGQVEHIVWYETLPPNHWIWIGMIAAGDQISASIELKAGSTQSWQLTLVDRTTRQVFPETVSFPSLRVYASYIVEDPDATDNNGPPYYPFPRFTPVTFHNADVRYSNDWVSIAAIRGLQVTLEQSGVVLARPGPLVNDTFTVTHGNSSS